MAVINVRAKEVTVALMLTHSCPTCRVPAGAWCRGVRRQDGSYRKRETLHRERWRKARSALNHPRKPSGRS